MKDTDQLFDRAMHMLEHKMDTPQFLFAYWRAMDVPTHEQPWPEVCKPWWSGLESYLK